MFTFLSRRWGLSSREGSLLIQLLLLATTILAYSVMSMAIANSLFVNYVGANSLPLAFILIGLCSMPAYGLFSTAIDLYSRPKLFRSVLLFSIAIVIGLRCLLNLDSIAVYYGLLIAVFFQWDFYNNILYPSLVIDYFTSLEYKRYTPFIGIAQAVGTLIGGGMTIALSQYLRTRDLLWGLPLVLAISFCQILYLEKSQPRLDLVKPKEKTSLIASVKNFPKLTQEYPLVLLLAGSSFLLVIIYLSSEFLWFNIYGNSFSEQELTSFLGLMRIVISLVQVAVLYGVTRPLLQFCGVANLNGVYPVTTLLSFAGLLLNFKLPSAIGLHINGDALYKGINLPIHQLNYNAIPSEFRGRVRALSDGLIYAVGLTLAGIVLWVAHNYLSLVQITWIAASLTVLLLLVRFPMGKYYAQSLEQMIRGNTIDLDELAREGIQLPSQSQDAIREMLTSSDRYVQLKGLELAGNLGQLSDFFAEISPILATADDEIRDAIVKLLATASEVEILFKQLLAEESAITYITAWELAINKAYSLPKPKIEFSSPKTTTTTATVTNNYYAIVRDCDLATLAAEIEPANLTVSEQKSLIRAVSWSNQSQAIFLLSKILEQGSEELKYQTLKALTNFATQGNEQLAQIATEYIEHSEPSIRITAWKIIELSHCESILSDLTWGLADTNPRVRQQIASSLAAYGKAGLLLARESLASGDRNVVDTAIAAIGKIGTRQATDILYKYLTPDFTQLSRTQKWRQQIPTDDATWKPLKIAVADYQQRLIQKVLYILSCLGRSRTVNSINQILASRNETDIANAVEVLASMQQRRFVVPLIPILEQQLKSATITPIKADAQWLKNKGYKILLEALATSDRWLKSSALIALASIPSNALSDNDPVVQAIAKDLFTPNQAPNNTLMNRLLLLKEVSLFKNLSLDELLAIEKALIPEQVLTNQTIYTEGSWGSHFYIVAEGRVKLTKQVESQPQEIKQVAQGQYFGEIAIFDDAPRWDTATALENSTLLKLEKKRFLNLISQRPHIILEICRFLSQRLRETDKYLSVKKSI
ncbi:putative Transcriptional regulator [Hyella patelloides LEGE 07179]|uniref:Putative Transcriptional regulator n=1 Tax=Hyella patelloides LEGE 07179 TaxID=945734 RepID=A0A563VNU9_9CYAN|nr:cyclic nucleotide-binding domain-containing protein [Hyella patelloides]VEP13047.1 putative Transcriptional regulator [Hyella patelloides LEGE 07179]